jgi:hypothetical protein
MRKTCVSSAPPCIYIYIYILVLLLGADRLENSFPSVVSSIRIYGAVAWQRVDQIRYNTVGLLYLTSSNMPCSCSSWMSSRIVFYIFCRFGGVWSPLNVRHF